MLEIVGSSLVCLEPPRARVRTVFRIAGAQVDTDLLCQHLECFAEGEVFFPHHKREGVAAGRAGAEAVPGTRMGKDHKTRRALAVKGAQPLVDAAGTFQHGVA